MFIAPKPASLDFLEAGALPLAGVAALMSIDALDPSAGDLVLIVGATGGVGSYAMQPAANRGAHVIATAWPEDEEYVRGLGAEGPTVARPWRIPAPSGKTRRHRPNETATSGALHLSYAID